MLKTPPTRVLPR
ncbi:Protein of unknown function [Propionibacterium freudenreichii]|nr:Protein of unknown function [Propionibacterium freudenreichii subsp. freudenreichii]CEG86973.1 Protein of unknown function [Propionibacterium freudenreichii]CEG88808.1 Protein of unknown function [Propionibacterium freudenreichii]CEG99221.1 Protein of unknown function [Propionibacterium freudenreichii]CEH01537.1 Protein of unknown function [Propionibacterium freudenreichii]